MNNGCVRIFIQKDHVHVLQLLQFPQLRRQGTRQPHVSKFSVQGTAQFERKLDEHTALKLFKSKTNLSSVTFKRKKN